ncbi:MAG: TolC family protein, partial [Bacteroidia bacterium]|nr:TolC family protein [Bacteroidia bacterium]
MMKNLFILLVGIILVSVVPAAHAQKIWSLQNCIDYAIENNIQIKQQALNNQYQQN